jgi:alpha-tubulin suppressor-like RCC1 family protein
MVWAWGSNFGNLGDETFENRSSPISIHRFGSYVAVAAGYQHSLFIDGSDRSIWACGSNNAGQLGDNSQT